MRLALIGFAFGLPVAIAVMRVFQSQVLGIGTLDPVPIAGIVGVTLAVAALASWLPARRATAVDPMESLRSE
jgi:ABC-type antimicrobial peptide transport system permease subunit